MKRVMPLMVWLAVALAVPAPTAAQDTAWRVENVRSLGDLVPALTDTPPHHYYLAADGRHILVEERGDGDGICSADLATGDMACIPVPSDLSHIRVESLFPTAALADDGSGAALVGSALIYFRDTDLGVADFTDLSFRSLSDDAYEGDLMFDPAGAGSWVESQPAWSPDGTRIAVERTPVGEDGRPESSHIAVFDLTTGEARDLTGIPGVDWQVDWGSTLDIDWSPDGATLAFAVRHVELDFPFDGVWTVDAAGGAPERLVTMDQAQEAYQTLFPDEVFGVLQVRWSPDGERILFWVNRPGGNEGHLWAFWIELASGVVTPVPLPAADLDLSEGRARWPANAAWSPDGAYLLVAAHDSEAPDLDQAPMLFGEASGQVFSLWIVDVASGEPTLLGYLPAQPADVFAGAWSASGDVIIAGYTFKLVRD